MTEDAAAAALEPGAASSCSNPHGHNAIAVFRRRWKDGFRKTFWTICIYCEHREGPFVSTRAAWQAVNDATWKDLGQEFPCRICGGEGFIGDPKDAEHARDHLTTSGALQRCPQCDGAGTLNTPMQNTETIPAILAYKWHFPSSPVAYGFMFAAGVFTSIQTDINIPVIVFVVVLCWVVAGIHANVVARRRR